MTPDILSHFRSAVPCCDLVLYADIQTGTVLASDSRLHMAQEVLDALCTSASALFAAPTLTPDRQMDHAVMATPTGLRVFIKSQSAPGETLCCLCGPGADIADVLSHGRTALAALGAAL